MLEVVDAGLYSTVQDHGRVGQSHLGVRRAGAADDLAMAVANLLLDNQPGAPLLEMTLLGGTFLVHGEMLVSIAGADMEAHVPEEGRALAVGASHRLHAGTSLRFGGAIDGARAYLALAGGIAAEMVLGSASTDPVAGFGGLAGRQLHQGEQILSGHLEPRLGPAARWPDGEPRSGVATAPGPRRIRIVPGPHLARLPATLWADLSASVWQVTPRSDRAGIRLAGAPLHTGDLDLVSLPMLPGAIQVPPNGQPILLMPDAPTVGGYPVPAVIAAVDRCVAAQLRPGDEVRFEWAQAGEMRALAAQRRTSMWSIAGLSR